MFPFCSFAFFRGTDKHREASLIWSVDSIDSDLYLQGVALATDLKQAVPICVESWPSPLLGDLQVRKSVAKFIPDPRVFTIEPFGDRSPSRVTTLELVESPDGLLHGYSTTKLVSMTSTPKLW